MFVHYSSEKPHSFLGVSRAERDLAINVPVTEEQYVEWIMNPSLVDKFNLLSVNGEWKLITVMQRTVLPDAVLEPLAEDDETPVDVMLVLNKKGKAYVHVFNAQMASDPECKTFFYGVEAEDAMAAVFDIEAVGEDTEKDVEFDPENLEVWVKAPLETIKYGLKITS